MNFEQQVRAWIDTRALVELAQTGFDQVDIDELLDPAPARAASTMFDCMDLALAGFADVTVAGMVVIPLPFVADQSSPRPLTRRSTSC